MNGCLGQLKAVAEKLPDDAFLNKALSGPAAGSHIVLAPIRNTLESICVALEGCTIIKIAAGGANPQGISQWVSTG